MSYDLPTHYLYRLTDRATGDFYVGVRSCRVTPDQDRRYMGSGRWPRHMAYDGVALAKEVLGTFPSRELAEEAESLLIDMVVTQRGCRNSIKTASEDVKAPHRRKWGYV